MNGVLLPIRVLKLQALNPYSKSPNPLRIRCRRFVSACCSTSTLRAVYRLVNVKRAKVSLYCNVLATVTA